MKTGAVGLAVGRNIWQSKNPIEITNKLRKIIFNMITIINFKTYKQGESVLEFAKKIEKVDKNIIVGFKHLI